VTRHTYRLRASQALLLCALLAAIAFGLGPATGITQAGITQPAPAQAGPTDDPRLVAATYLGGAGADYGRAVALDAAGNIYVAGDTFSSSFLGRSLDRKGGSDIVVAKLSPDGKRLLGLFSIGSPSSERVGGMAVTPAGEVVLSVETADPGFPLHNALHTTVLERNPGALLKINAALDGLVFSTFTTFTVGYEHQNVALDDVGNISVAGFVYEPYSRARDLALQKFSPDGQRLLFEKVWDNDQSDEIAETLVVRPDGATYIAGSTDGRFNDLAVTENAVQKVCGSKLALGDGWQCDQDAFVIALSPTGDVTYASYLGGLGGDKAVGLAVDSQGAIYLVGATGAPDFPTTPGAFQPRCPQATPEDSCRYDAFVAKLAPDGSQLAYSTYLGSTELGGLDYPVGIVVDADGNASVVGFTASERWPTKNALQGALNAFPCPNAFQDRLCFDSVVTTFAPDGQLAFSSYLGGTFDETTTNVAVGPDGSLYLTGYTESADYPVSADGVQPEPRSGAEAFLAHINRRATSAPATPTPTTPTTPPASPPGDARIYLPFITR
jgi:hypothetical protein